MAELAQQIRARPTRLPFRDVLHSQERDTSLSPVEERLGATQDGEQSEG